ncbi:hypothetical protein MKX03_005031 [Papaver bracteatum]|nr:hypothetical protein MKX03_005031 [Papaver bracteatum]
MERAMSQGIRIFEKKPADLMQIFKDVQSKVSDVIMGNEKSMEESNPEYEKFKQDIFELEDHLAEAQKHAYHLSKQAQRHCWASARRPSFWLLVKENHLATHLQTLERNPKYYQLNCRKRHTTT